MRGGAQRVQANVPRGKRPRPEYSTCPPCSADERLLKLHRQEDRCGERAIGQVALRRQGLLDVFD